MSATATMTEVLHDADEFDMCECADCHRHFPGGQLRCYPHGNICEECHEDRQDAGVTREAFGASPRDVVETQEPEPQESECCQCQQLFPIAKLETINAKEKACPECHRAIMRDFRACDE